MGCYGIGVTRIIGAVAEASHDDQGLIWPEALAPFQVAVLVLDAKSESEMAQGAEIAAQIEATTGVTDVCLDDRADSAGRKLKDASLIGFPYSIVIGKAFRKQGQVELQVRHTGEKVLCTPSEAVAKVAEAVGSAVVPA